MAEVVDDATRAANFRAGAMRLGLVAASLGDFAGLVISHVRAGGALDDGSLGQLRADAIRNFKMTEAHGLSDVEVGELFKAARSDFEAFVDLAIQNGTKPAVVG
jgi:hypothetical protein